MTGEGKLNLCPFDDCNAWILTREGNPVCLTAPDLSSISIDEVANALACLARYSGNTSDTIPYSVAQHCVLVSQHAPPEHAFAALMHDAHEALIGDWTSPVKRALVKLGAEQALAELDRRAAAAVAKRWGVAFPLSEAVKWEDRRAIATERRDVFPETGPRFGVGVEPWPEKIIPWPTRSAAGYFLMRFEQVRP